MRLTRTSIGPTAHLCPGVSWRRWTLVLPRILTTSSNQCRWGLRSGRRPALSWPLMVTFSHQASGTGPAGPSLLWVDCMAFTWPARAPNHGAAAQGHWYADSPLVRCGESHSCSRGGVAWIFFRAENLVTRSTLSPVWRPSCRPALRRASQMVSQPPAGPVVARGGRRPGESHVLAAAGLARSRWNLHSPEVFIQASPRGCGGYLSPIGFALVIFPAPATRASSTINSDAQA